MLALVVSGLALILGVIAVVMVLTRDAPGSNGGGSGSDSATCRSAAWDAFPAQSALGSAWSVHAPTLFSDGIAFQLDGPDAGDGSGPLTVNVSVTCYQTAAHDFVGRSAAAAKQAGATATSFPSIGDESVALQSTETDSLSVIVRHGSLVATLDGPTAVGSATLEQLARAQVEAMGGAAAPIPSPVPSGSAGAVASASPEASASATAAPHEVPSLEALLPKSVPASASTPATTLTTSSATGDTALGSDATSAAIQSGLIGLGKKAADLQVAQAYDIQQTIVVTALRINGVPAATLRQIMVQGWTAAISAGASTTAVTMSGLSVTRLDASDGSFSAYFLDKGGAAFMIEAPDEATATLVVAALK